MILLKDLNDNLELIKRIIRTDQDWLHIVTGYEGSGKSNLGIQICKTIDPTFIVKRITFTSEEFLIAINEAKPYQAILMDEGVEGFFSRRAMSKENVDIAKTLTQIRFKNLFICICIPDWFLLDSYVRSHRVRSLTVVKERGIFAFYSKRQTKKIRRNPNNKVTEYGTAFFHNTFKKPDYPLWDDYENKKKKYTNTGSKVVWDLRQKIDKKRGKSFTLRDIATIHGLNPATVKNWYKKYDFFPKGESFKDVFGHIRVTKKGYKRGMKKVMLAKEGGFKKYLKKPKKMKK